MNNAIPFQLGQIVSAQKRGEPRGIFSICSANPAVLNASFHFAAANELPLLVESTCNQVNQFGGYTGMKPSDFYTFVCDTAAKHEFPIDRMVIGGDHLGPNPWQAEPANQAMDKAKVLVHDYVMTGYSKIHLDTSMKLGDDDPEKPLEKELIAKRAATLAQVAEDAWKQTSVGNAQLSYVIGTEVPIPGGAQSNEEALEVTSTEDALETIEIHQQAFFDQELKDAWDRVIAVVVQPGVEFGDEEIHEYDRERAHNLSQFINNYDHLVYEAHSTDYQSPKALKQLVEDHFAILKVGPALTFAYREAVFALANIESEMSLFTSGIEESVIRETLDHEMRKNPVYWQDYYHGSSAHQKFSRMYSLSDRCRYYWPTKSVQTALNQLNQNLEANPPPLTLLSQFLPEQYVRVRNGEIENTPTALIRNKITSVLKDYAEACYPK